MEKAQVCKSACNNQLQQSIYFCHKRKMSQIWQENTMMHTYTSPNQCPYQGSTPYGIKEITQTTF